jgi:RloB-like protein
MPRLMRRQRRRIFVGCEGEGERSYVALMQRIVDGVHQKVHLDAQLLQPGGGDPLDLARRAEEVIKKIERTREPYDEKYLLIDRDTLGNSPQRDRETRAILNRIDARVLWQDPTHEALILRHLPGCARRRPASTQIAMHQLRQQWPQYKKPMSAMQLANRIGLEGLRQAASVENDLRVLLASIDLF